MLLAATGLLGACASDEEAQQKGPVPIRLTASVNSTAMTRSIDQQGVAHTVVTRGVQETVLTNGEKVYVWGKEGSSSSWTAQQAWTLTSDGSGGLSGTTKYYPLDGSTLTMVAVHGNFAETLTEGSTAIGTLTHSVETDQNATGNYEKSDLLWGTATGSDGDATLNIPFVHKLSKIEVNLTPGYGYTADDLTTAEVHLYNVLPSVTINPSDGTLGDASGDADTIKMRKNTSTGAFEAVIPSQTFANPDAVISVTIDNNTLTPPAKLTSTVPNTVATFFENTKYQYTARLDHPVTNLTELKEFITEGYEYADFIGYYVTSTGAISTSPNSAIGVIGKLHSSGQGLILALKDATSQTFSTINNWTTVSYAGTTLKVLPNASARGSLTSYTSLGNVSVSNWAVAQISDYSEIFYNLGSQTTCQYGYVYDSIVNSVLTACSGGTGFSGTYWSATIGGSGDLANWFSSSNWGQYYTSQSYNVRPVLAF